MEKDGKKFVLRKSALSTIGHNDMQKILNHPKRLKELWECLGEHSKIPDKTILMDKYEKMLHSDDTDTFPISQELQGKYRLLIKLKY
jgi:hypothetical protein